MEVMEAFMHSNSQFQKYIKANVIEPADGKNSKNDDIEL